MQVDAATTVAQPAGAADAGDVELRAGQGPNIPFFVVTFRLTVFKFKMKLYQ